uniref:Membrane-spanning 4-domains subfamily A member 12 n=1 Tax=Esox lucius TaxID=8010 RepID=A0A3P9AGB9_ESOLU
MAVSVSNDLSVSITTDVNADKLADKRQALRESIRKGEPKAFGVMLGLLVMSFSLPLLFTEFTEVVSFGVPWWSSLTFITAGVIAIVLEKRTSMKSLCVCMGMTLVAALVSFLAFIFYMIDLHNNPETACNEDVGHRSYLESSCEDQHFATMMSYGVKSSLLFFTMIQVVISSSLSYILFKERRNYGQYASLGQSFPS